MALTKPRSHLFQIKNEERGIDRHVENASGEREPGFLKTPEVTEAAPNPGVVATFLRQRAGKLANHERGGADSRRSAKRAELEFRGRSQRR